MVGDMKFEEPFLTRYLVKNLEPLTEADPVILAEYVAALLKKDKPNKELQKLCAENLVEFLGQGTKSFVTQLFQALEEGSIVAPAESSDAIEQVEPSPSLITEDPIELKNSSSKPEGISPSSRASDQEDKEVSDDDDDDRNHKHRRRGTRSLSFDKNVQGQFLRRPNRNHNKTFENGQMFLESDPQSGENRKEYNPAPFERDHNARFERKHPGLAPLPWSPFDSALRTRIHQSFRGGPGLRFDLSTSLGRPPTGRGRGRSSGPWSRHDSKFSSVDNLDFVSQMGPQGATPPSLFAGGGLQPFGLIPGMPNGGIDTLHPLGLQGTIGPPINQSLSIGLPHQRCRDFEERGFCLRGDMCPMEHGVNRIVVEDVQSLSQFNLPVSLPSARLLGTSTGAGSLPLGSASSTLLTNNKSLHGKSSKSGMTDDGLGLNRVLSATGASEADLYDPDQPLWNNDHPETSSAPIRNSSPKVHDTESLWDADPSDHHNLRSSTGIDNEHPARSVASAVSSQCTSLSVWGRIGNSGNKLGMTGKFDVSSRDSMGYLGKEAKDEAEAFSSVPVITHKRKQIASENIGPKAMNSTATPRMQNDPARRVSQKALRTLFVNGIPLINNKREALLSHFQKFGEIIDIYIPLNSEKAFIQFSKREAAEAALKSPDAVMGNRFIKLWWANRDSIPDNGISNGNTVSSALHSLTDTTVPPQPSVANGRNVNLPSMASKINAVPASDAPVLAVVHPRPMVTNSPKIAPPSQKKLENLELLKEELRLKQEMLDQKRNEFRRQLDRLEKQTMTVRGEATVEQAVKRPKLETVADVSKAGNLKPKNPGTIGHRPGAEKTLDQNNSEESIVSPSSTTSSTLVLQSARSLRQPSRLSVPVGTPLPGNRFKLDNRSTSFRILPPLPADLSNVLVLREHFSSFGDVFAVELEDPETNLTMACSETSEHCSARVTFTTRHSAERAFLNGKLWQGHNLQFLWLNASNNSSNDHTGGEDSSTSTPKGPPNADILVETATSGFSSSSIGKSTCGVSQAANSTGNGESDNSERIKDDVEPMEPMNLTTV